MQYSLTVNDEWIGEMEWSEVIDHLLRLSIGDKVLIEVV